MRKTSLARGCDSTRVLSRWFPGILPHPHLATHLGGFLIHYYVLNNQERLSCTWNVSHAGPVSASQLIMCSIIASAVKLRLPSLVVSSDTGFSHPRFFFKWKSVVVVCNKSVIFSAKWWCRRTAVECLYVLYYVYKLLCMVQCNPEAKRRSYHIKHHCSKTSLQGMSLMQRQTWLPTTWYCTEPYLHVFYYGRMQAVDGPHRGLRFGAKTNMWDATITY